MDFARDFCDLIYNQIKQCPITSEDLASAVNKKRVSGNADIVFAERVRAGETATRDVKTPLKLKHKKFTNEGITIYVKNIKYMGQKIKEELYGEGSFFVFNTYKLTYSITYK